MAPQKGSVATWGLAAGEGVPLSINGCKLGTIAASICATTLGTQRRLRGGDEMRVRRLKITNFRGISQGSVDFAGHTLLVGGNNIGKSTVCEALDLVLGPERLFRRPVVDEHDFHCGRYLDENGAPIEIRIEAILVDLSEEATRRFGGHLRRWNDQAGTFIDEKENGLDQADGPGAVWALPLLFVGRYDRDEDDFVGNTFFDHPTKEV